MEKRFFNFSKGLGIFFALAAGIGTAVLGYVDRTDWIQVVFYSVAVVALVLWGWHHFSIKWSYGLSSTKKDLEKFMKDEERKKITYLKDESVKSTTIVIGNKLK